MGLLKVSRYYVGRVLLVGALSFLFMGGVEGRSVRVFLLSLQLITLLCLRALHDVHDDTIDNTKPLLSYFEVELQNQKYKLYE